MTVKYEKVTLDEMINNKSFIESYKTLRTNLIYLDNIKTVAITSVSPNEGKTTASIYLAKSLTELGKKVLLIDGDLRRGSMRNFFRNNSSTSGLRDAIFDNTCNYIAETDVENLYVLLSAKLPKDPTELLSNNKFKILLEKLKGSYDYIIIDTPPLSFAADATIISRLVDGVILTIRYDFTKKKITARYRNELSRTGVNFLGVVFTRVRQESLDYYNYGYGYGYERKI